MSTYAVARVWEALDAVRGELHTHPIHPWKNLPILIS
jgi:hypothetical protein